MTKKAVVVGINDYAPIGAGGPDLNGCINDARDMANTLVICGFHNGQPDASAVIINKAQNNAQGYPRNEPVIREVNGAENEAGNDDRQYGFACPLLQQVLHATPEKSFFNNGRTQCHNN